MMENLLDDSGAKKREAERQKQNPLEIALNSVQKMNRKFSQEIDFFDTFKKTKTRFWST